MPGTVIRAGIGRAAVATGLVAVSGEVVVAGAAGANGVGDGCFAGPSARSLAAVLQKHGGEEEDEKFSMDLKARIVWGDETYPDEWHISLEENWVKSQ